MVMGDALAQLNLSESGSSAESPKKSLATAFFNQSKQPVKRDSRATNGLQNISVNRSKRASVIIDLKNKGTLRGLQTQFTKLKDFNKTRTRRSTLFSSLNGVPNPSKLN